MPYFVMLTRLSHDGMRSPKRLMDLEGRVVELVRNECPDVEWVHNFVVLGPYDYLDIFSAPDGETAFRVATIVQTFGNADTEVWGATEWEKYKEMVRLLPGGHG